MYMSYKANATFIHTRVRKGNKKIKLYIAIASYNDSVNVQSNRDK